MDNIENLYLMAGSSYKEGLKTMMSYIFSENKVAFFAKCTNCSGQTEYLVRVNAMLQYILEQHMITLTDVKDVLNNLSQIDLEVLIRSTFIFLQSKSFLYKNSNMRKEIYRQNSSIKSNDKILFELEILTYQFLPLIKKESFPRELGVLLSA